MRYILGFLALLTSTATGLAQTTVPLEVADGGYLYATIPIRLKPNGPFDLDFFVRLCVGDLVTAKAEFDTGAAFNMLMLQPAYNAARSTSLGGGCWCSEAGLRDGLSS